MKKVLILSLSGIGNYIMQAPAIAAIKKAQPTWHITVWVAPRGTKALAQADTNVDAVIEMPIRASIAQHLMQIMQLRRKNFDIGIVLSPGQHFKSALYLFLAGIPQRVGSKYPLRGNTSSVFLTDSTLEEPGIHDIEQNIRLLAPLTISAPSIKTYSIHIPAEHITRAAEYMRQLSIAPDKKIIGLHAGSAPDLAFKRWPLERFSTLAITLVQNHNAHILVFGGESEEVQKKTLVTSIEKSAPGLVSRVSDDLLTTAAIIAKCSLFISNDSGLMHLAAAVGTQTIGLFGPTDERLTGPRGEHSEALRAPNTSPVYSTDSPNSAGQSPHSTILALTPEMVLARLTRYL